MALKGLKNASRCVRVHDVTTFKHDQEARRIAYKDSLNREVQKVTIFIRLTTVLAIQCKGGSRGPTLG